MTNYLSEAYILARAGVISIIPDAPARGDGKNSELNTMKLEAARDHIAEMVMTERRVLDLLLQQPGGSGPESDRQERGPTKAVGCSQIGIL